MARGRVRPGGLRGRSTSPAGCASARGLVLRAGVLNLTDRKYFEWANVRGRLASDPVIDRYSSPGISGIVSLSAGW